MSDVQKRTAAAARIDAAFERYNARPLDVSCDRLEYEQQRADDASTILCHLIGALEAVVGSDYLEVTAERVAEAVELSVAAVFAGADGLDALGNDEAPAPPAEPVAHKHALPPIDYPGRLAGATPGPRCGAQGPTALFAADVTCPKCIALMVADDTARVLHWPARGLRTTTLCQGEPLTSADFAETKADVTCPACLADMAQDGGQR